MGSPPCPCRSAVAVVPAPPPAPIITFAPSAPGAALALVSPPAPTQALHDLARFGAKVLVGILRHPSAARLRFDEASEISRQTRELRRRLESLPGAGLCLPRSLGDVGDCHVDLLDRRRLLLRA